MSLRKWDLKQRECLMNLRRIKNKIVYGLDDLRGRLQRFKRGWSYGDAKDLDFWFMDNVKPMLIYLRDHGMGVPNELYVEGENERINWENILTEMISCIELMDEDNAAKHLGISDDDCTLISCKKIGNCMEENKNRFFELFSKWFYSLWD